MPEPFEPKSRRQFDPINVESSSPISLNSDLPGKSEFDDSEKVTLLGHSFEDINKKMLGHPKNPR